MKTAMTLQVPLLKRELAFWVALLILFVAGTDKHTVRDIAYDVLSDTLYWTSQNAIYRYNKSMKNNEGEILIKLDDKDIPHGIALDRCRR